MFRRKNKSVLDNNNVSDVSNNEPGKRKGIFKKNRKGKVSLRFILILLVVVTAAAVALFVFISISGNQGMRKSQKLSKKIGESSEKAASYADIDLTSASDFSFVNELVPFTSIAESGKTTRIYDVKVPEWTIFCSENSFGKLESVTYCDFRIMKNNINGIKKSSRIATESINVGSSLSEVETLLNMNPYQVVYSENSISRKYKYYYKDKQSDVIKAYYITVVFSKDNKVNSPVIEEENNFIYDFLKSENG